MCYAVPGLCIQTVTLLCAHIHLVPVHGGFAMKPTLRSLISAGKEDAPS